jgi:hypothetical protein
VSFIGHNLSKPKGVTKMTQSITVTVEAWNGEREMGLDEYVSRWTELTDQLSNIVDIDSDTLHKDMKYINEVRAWTKKKAVQKFMALYASQNA